jgi:hypothetical protein
MYAAAEVVGNNGDVNGPGMETFDQVVALALDILDVYIRKSLLIFPQHRAQAACRWRNVGTDLEPAGVALCIDRCIEQSDIEFGQNAPDLFQKSMAGSGWTDPMAVTVEQSDTDENFQTPDTPADSGCGHADQCAGFMEAPLLGRDQGLYQGIEFDIPDSAQPIARPGGRRPDG